MFSTCVTVLRGTVHFTSVLRQHKEETAGEILRRHLEIYTYSYSAGIGAARKCFGSSLLFVE